MYNKKRFILNKKSSTSIIIKKKAKRLLSYCCTGERWKRIKDITTKWSKSADRLAKN
jgi:hypothetical protein